jgi:hypothetical protein
MKSLTDEERFQMGMNGYNYIMKNHSIDMLAKRFAKILNE